MRALVATLFAVGFVLAAGAAQAGDTDVSPADEKAMREYTLSMAKINAMQGAQDDLKNLLKTHPDIGKGYENAGNAKSLVDAERMLNSITPFVTILHKHGLTTADAVLMPMVLMSASVAAKYPSAAAKLSSQTSPAQISFYKAHEAELKKERWLFGGGD